MLKQEQLKSLLEYDPDTGLFKWIVSRCGTVNINNAGYTRPNGYRVITIGGRNYYAHRLAFLYMTGAFPPEMVDHRDGDPTNNRWSNLRPATPRENILNRAGRGAVPFKGVYKVGKRFRAMIRLDGVLTHLGYFPTPEQAHQCWSDAAQVHHGEFFRAA